jgi:hypothetical protein
MHLKDDSSAFLLLQRLEIKETYKYMKPKECLENHMSFFDEAQRVPGKSILNGYQKFTSLPICRANSDIRDACENMHLREDSTTFLLLYKLELSFYEKER